MNLSPCSTPDCYFFQQAELVSEKDIFTGDYRPKLSVYHVRQLWQQRKD